MLQWGRCISTHSGGGDFNSGVLMGLVWESTPLLIAQSQSCRESLGGTGQADLESTVEFCEGPTTGPLLDAVARRDRREETR